MPGTADSTGMPTRADGVFGRPPVLAALWVAAVNLRPLFSDPPDPAKLAALARSFPESRAIGPYVVRWRRGL